MGKNDKRKGLWARKFKEHEEAGYQRGLMDGLAEANSRANRERQEAASRASIKRAEVHRIVGKLGSVLKDSVVPEKPVSIAASARDAVQGLIDVIREECL